MDCRGFLLLTCAACFAFPATSSSCAPTLFCWGSSSARCWASFRFALCSSSAASASRNSKRAARCSRPDGQRLRVGHSFNAALGLVSRECADPIGSEFRTCFDEQNYGLELRSALENLTARIPLQDLKIVVTAILIQRESGGNLAEVLEKTAYVIRERFRLKRQVMVHTAQGRMTGWILTILPVALGIGLYIVNPSTESLLWNREIGVKLLFAAGGMLTVGSMLIQKIVRMDV